MRDKKVNTDPELYDQLKEGNLRFKSLSFKNSSADTVSSLEDDVFLEFEQQPVIEKKASIQNSTRFYISSSEISRHSAYEDNDPIIYRRNTL